MRNSNVSVQITGPFAEVFRLLAQSVSSAPVKHKLAKAVKPAKGKRKYTKKNAAYWAKKGA